MDNRAFDELQVIKLEHTGYTSHLNRTNLTTNAQQENFTVKKTTNRCLFIWIGIIVGGIVSGLTVFFVMKYDVMLSSCREGFISADNNSSCFWTEWTSWTPCKFSLMIEEQTRAQIGKQIRAQMFTGYSKSCEQKERFETKSCYDFTFERKFDASTLYSTCYLSDDLTMLSNRFTDRASYNPKARSRFQRYQGAMVNTCVENVTSIYYEIYFKYVITSTLSNDVLLLELGIGERMKIDNYYYVGSSNVSGWSFYLADCLTNGRVCLFAQHEPDGINKVIKLFSNNRAGTNVNGTLGILIDRQKNIFSLFYNDTVLFNFYDVLSNVSLCPVFGVYNPRLVQVDLQIASVGNMTLAL